jgi:hypothetical protein
LRYDLAWPFVFEAFPTSGGFIHSSIAKFITRLVYVGIALYVMYRSKRGKDKLSVGVR